MRLPWWRKADDAPLEAETPVVTSQAVNERGEPVRLVVHFYDEDPLWSFLSNAEQEDDEPLLLHAAHLLESDTRLNEVVDLPAGTLALRHRLDDPWHRRRFCNNDEFDRWLFSGDLAPTWPYPETDRGGDQR